MSEHEIIENIIKLHNEMLILLYIQLVSIIGIVIMIWRCKR
jgi:hypothetical protein